MQFYSAGPAFNDTIDSLKNELKNDTSNCVIVFGAYLFPISKLYELKNKYNKVIVFNMEQLNAEQRNFLTKQHFLWLKLADEVWDYDEQNIEVLKLIRPDVKLHILKPYKDWSVYKPVEKDIDILFYGSMNEHRNELLNHLSKKYKVVVFDGHNSIWKNLDSYILRSKVLLNIHFYNECACQEQARMIRWIGAPCKIISEKSWKNYLNVPEFEYKDLFNL